MPQLTKQQKRERLIRHRLEQSIRLSTAWLRALPDFLIIGGLKCGTTSLYQYLCTHPQIHAAMRKELFYFDRFFDRGTYWYRSHFPMDFNHQNWLTGEASPHYIQHPLAAERIRELMPNIKLIVLLRDPVLRLLSHYKHNVRNGWETLDFAAAMEAEESRVAQTLKNTVDHPEAFEFDALKFSYFRKGLYADQLVRWYSVFPPAQILVLQSESLFRNPRAVVDQTLHFLGLEPHECDEFPQFNAATNEVELPTDVGDIAARYAEPNERLYQLINCRFGWMESGNPMPG